EVLMQAIKATQADIEIRVANRFPIIGDWAARRHEGEPGLAPAWFGLEAYAWGGEQLELAQFDIPDHAYGASFQLMATETGFSLADAEGNVLATGPLQETVSFPV